MNWHNREVKFPAESVRNSGRRKPVFFHCGIIIQSLAKKIELDFHSILAELNNHGVDYLVVGGLAVNFHGIPRMTYDVDLMIRLEAKNILKLVSKLSEWGYRPKVPIDPVDLADRAKRDSWIRQKGMRALNFYSETLPIGEIDIILDSPIPYSKLKKKAVKIGLQRQEIPTISIHDLIELKLYAGRKHDLADVEHLRRILET